MRKILDNKTEKEITELYASGLQLTELAEKYNCSNGEGGVCNDNRNRYKFKQRLY